MVKRPSDVSQREAIRAEHKLIMDNIFFLSYLFYLQI